MLTQDERMSDGEIGAAGATHVCNIRNCIFSCSGIAHCKTK